MLQLSNAVKSGQYFKDWSTYIIAFFIAFPQFGPQLLDLPGVPDWFKNTISIALTITLIVKTIKQNGFKPALK